MRTIIWFIYFWLYLLLMLPEYWKVKKLEQEGKREEHDKKVRYDVHNWASRLLSLAGAKIETRGKENIPEGPVVFIGNHQGYFDIPLMITQMDKPNPLIAKKEIQKIPMIRSWMKELRCIFIDRQDARQSMDCLKQAQELLKEGYSVVIFPEGTRVKSREEGEPKTGAAMLACRTGVNVLPVYIPMKKKPFRINRVYIGKPYKMIPEGKRATSKDYDTFTADLMDRIYNLGDGV